MKTSNLDRRKFLGLALASGVAGPAVLRASRVEAAEIEKIAGKLLVVGYPGSGTGDRSTGCVLN